MSFFESIEQTLLTIKTKSYENKNYLYVGSYAADEHGCIRTEYRTAEGDVNNDGKVDVADIVKIIDIMAAAEQPQTTKYTWYLGETEQEAFTVNDFNMTGTKPTTLNIGSSSGNRVTVWIYPQSWGKPTQILDPNGNDMTNGFFYGDDWMTVPADHYGAWVQTPIATVWTLTWP